MDYDKFRKDWDHFNEWYSKVDQNTFKVLEEEIEYPYGKDDRVNSPSHYTAGKVEAIDIIEDAIAEAPSPNLGFLQAQVLKYLLRLWLKDNPLEDAKKAQWYLNRLIAKGESAR